LHHTGNFAYLADLFAHHLNNDALPPLPIKLGVINLLPWAEIQFTFSYWHNYLMVHEQAFQVRITISLTGLVMAVILAEWRQMFQPFIDVGDQSVFGVVDPDARGYVHSGYQDHTFLDIGFCKGLLDFVSNI
jgi:hypothetical protein